MSRAQQPSILSFFQPRQNSAYTAPPSTAPPSTSNNTSADASSPPLLPPIIAATALLPPTLPILPSPPSLPAQASVVPVTEQHIPALRRINSLLLPVAYPDSFYAKALQPLASGLFSRTILWKDASDAGEPKVVGGVVCRLEPNSFLSPQQPSQVAPAPPTYYAIYIQSLVLLSPYRSQGLAAAALEHIVASASILPAAGSSIDARTIYAHVWTENEEGLRWYQSRGFSRHGSEPIKGYYFKLRPDTAWIMRRDIGPGTTPEPPAPLPSPGSRSVPATARGSGGSGSNNTSSTVAAAVNLPAMKATATASQTGPPPPRAPPRQLSTTSTSSAASSSLSFQNTRPETEWNDLPADMVSLPTTPGGAGAGAGASTPTGSGLLPPRSAPGSAPSSRSSSTAPPGGRKKKERAYPAAAFGQ
ncbi:hypothetical protein B0H66DRAFT_69885 [Apodospora peruviana]|uniref:N-acetyltransferase domain-containing protein n=1 Tax=Apodospora peruviana TaxID=516989 RepID=A0AAE0ISX5_9PEZI|nr:hypothetical protein B0H66DRAFT_69885 [Apodospora peruviana]